MIGPVFCIKLTVFIKLSENMENTIKNKIENHHARNWQFCRAHYGNPTTVVCHFKFNPVLIVRGIIWKNRVFVKRFNYLISFLSRTFSFKYKYFKVRSIFTWPYGAITSRQQLFLCTTSHTECTSWNWLAQSRPTSVNKHCLCNVLINCAYLTKKSPLSVV